jgi:type IV secretion system protein VirB4
MSTSAILNNQPAAEDRLPKIGRHVTPHVVAYTDDKALLVIKLAGMPFEALPDDVIVNRFDSRNRVFASLAKDKGNRLAIWTSLKRELVSFNSQFEFRSTFMRQFATKYLQRFSTGRYYENNFYISVLLKHDDLKEGAQELEDVGTQLMKGLAIYDPEMLTSYDRGGILFSQVYEFLGGLINGFKERQAVYAAPARETIPTSWLHWGYDMQEIRGADATRFAVSYDLKEFPARTKWGMFDKVLALDTEFTLTQSFLCMGVLQSQKAIKNQRNKLESVHDAATHQIDELGVALGYISSGELSFGEYHTALTVYGPTKEKAADNGTLVTTVFLTECGGARFIKAALSAPWTYLSHVPGAKVKPRPMMKSSRNLAAAFGMHNYSTGKSEGNPIGDGSAVIPLQTASSSLYNFNFHHSKEGENNLGEKIAGHTLILGATGAGKTTLETALIGFMERFDTKIFALDKDEGLKIFIAALGGVYYSLKAGERTGLAPFQLPDNPTNRQFLYGLVRTCAQDHEGKITDEESNQIKVAVDSVMSLEIQHRRFSRLLENIPGAGGNSLPERLAKWCEATDGEFAWALDNVADNMGVTFERMVGFDVSDFLRDDYKPTEPVLAYLFHLKSLMQKQGGLLATVVEEFYVPASYPSTQKMMFDVLKTGRKRDEFMVMASQSPEDAITSPIFAAIRDQTATKILLPNPSAEFESYKRVGLTLKEFNILKALDLESRAFLIKQGNQSCFAKLDLYGMDDEISILSGNTENIAIFNEVVSEVGTDPDIWMPEFQARRKGKKQAGRIQG